MKLQRPLTQCNENRTQSQKYESTGKGHASCRAGRQRRAETLPTPTLRQ